MNKSNLLTFLTTVTLVFVCSSTSASSVETKPAAAEAVAETTSESVSESVVSDSASDSSSVAEPATVDITQEQELETTEATVVQAVSDMEYTCKHDNARRIIRVFNDMASGLACEVTYEKASGTKTLWTAQYDKEFCAQKAAEFASKQVAWGWDCADKEGAVVAAPMAAPPAVESSVSEVSAPAPVPAEETKAPVLEETVIEAGETTSGI